MVWVLAETTIILGHMWLVEHSPKIDWSTGKFCMTIFPVVCGQNTTAVYGTNQLRFSSASYFGRQFGQVPKSEVMPEKVPHQGGPLKASRTLQDRSHHVTSNTTHVDIATTLG